MKKSLVIIPAVIFIISGISQLENGYCQTVLQDAETNGVNKNIEKEATPAGGKTYSEKADVNVPVARLKDLSGQSLEASGSADSFLRKTVRETYNFIEVPLKIRGPSMQRFLLDKAICVYEEGARRYAGYEKAARAQFLVGEIYKTHEEKDKALAAYEMIADSPWISEWSDNARLRISEIYFGEKDYDRARKNAFLLVDTYPRSDLMPQAYLIAAASYGKMADFANATNAYQKILELFDRKEVVIQALMGLGETYMASAKYAEAGEIYGRLLRDYADEASYDQAEFMSGKALEMQDNGAAARKIFRKIMAGPATNHFIDDAAYEEGRTYYRDGKYAQAIQSYASALIKYPEFEAKLDSLESMADSYRRLFLYRESLIKYAELVDAYYAMLDAPDLSEADRNAYAQKLAGLFFTMGEIYRQKGEADLASAKFLDAKKHTNSQKLASAADYSIAECYYDLGWYREALDIYEEYIPDNLDSPAVFNAIAHQADCYDRMGYLRKAQEIYLTLLSAEPENTAENLNLLKSEAAYHVGELYAELGMVREEAEFYEGILKEPHNYLDEARVLVRLGTVYESLGETERAATVYQRVIDNFREGDWYEIAKLNLEIIRINEKSIRNK